MERRQLNPFLLVEWGYTPDTHFNAQFYQGDLQAPSRPTCRQSWDTLSLTGTDIRSHASWLFDASWNRAPQRVVQEEPNPSAHPTPPPISGCLQGFLLSFCL